MKKEYKTPNHFRIALLDRLKQESTERGVSVQRLQRQVAYDRLLCRLFTGEKAPWVLKGGHALELRIQNSRATKDLDLALKDIKLFNAKSSNEQNERILERLQEKAKLNLNDFFEFTIGEAILDLLATPYGGARFPVESAIDNKTFIKFHIDVGVGDIWIEPHDEIELNDWLSFAGIASAKIPIISVEQHFAEKIHAYSLPRSGELNLRVKDLVDMVLLIHQGDLINAMSKMALKKAIEETFQRRGTHTIPVQLLSPPKEWERPFKAMAEECGLEMNLSEAFEKLVRFWNKGYL